MSLIRAKARQFSTLAEGNGTRRQWRGGEFAHRGGALQRRWEVGETQGKRQNAKGKSHLELCVSRLPTQMTQHGIRLQPYRLCTGWACAAAGHPRVVPLPMDSCLWRGSDQLSPNCASLR